VFYRVVSARAIEQTDLGYRLIGREMLKLRRRGELESRTVGLTTVKRLADLRHGGFARWWLVI
jgi:hypothetical protein